MSKYPHTEWVDLYGDGTIHECAVVKRDGIGNLYFIRIRELDMIDRRRLLKILTGRNALNFALWDLLFQTTLGNGVNALEYFHQYVKVRTPHGKIMAPQVGAIGAGIQQGVMKVSAPQAAPQVDQTSATKTSPGRRAAPPA